MTKAILQSYIYASDLEQFIPDANKIVELTETTKKGNWVYTVGVNKYIFDKITGKVVNFAYKDHAPRLCYDHSLLRRQ